MKALVVGTAIGGCTIEGFRFRVLGFWVLRTIIFYRKY